MMPVGAFSRCVLWGRYPLLLFASNHNPLDLIERDLIAASVIEAGSPGRLMGDHLLGDLQPAAVLEVGRDSGGAEGVAAYFGLDAGCLGAADDGMGVGLGQGSSDSALRRLSELSPPSTFLPHLCKGTFNTGTLRLDAVGVNVVVVVPEPDHSVD
jgi:hypothetical protein